MITVLTATAQSQVDALPGAALWLKAPDLERITGWQLKAEGLCQGDVCVPLPANTTTHFVQDDRINVSAFWELLGKPTAASAAGDVWALGEDAQSRNDALLSLEAPDFTLPDFTGKLHSLTDFRRQRVLLITWASW